MTNPSLALAGTVLLATGFLMASPALSQDTIDFEKQIWPFLERSCVECHKAPYEENGKVKKPKAGLRMDGAWAIKVGSENGKVLEPGNAEESELYYRVTLPEDDQDFMPPTGKADPLTAEEKELFKKWIDQGANFGGWAGNLEGKPAQLSNTGEEIPVSELQELYTQLSEGVTPLNEKDWASITEAGGRVEPLANNTPLLAVDFRLAEAGVTDAEVATTATVKDHTAQLDLSGSKITDESLKTIGQMEKLVRLDLHNTPVSDAGLAHLKKLEHLRYLNLYGTQVTDAGLKNLNGMKGLENLYLWQSQVTAAGVKQLQKSLPDTKINWK